MLNPILAQAGSAGLGAFLFCIVGFILVAALIVLATAIRIVPEYQRLVVFRLGRVLDPTGAVILRRA